MNLIWIDYGFIAFIGFFAMIGLVRGAATEAISLVTWLTGLGIGVAFSREMSVYLRSMISDPSLRLAAAFALLFVLTLIVGRVLRSILGQLIRSTGLRATDRLAGMFFGAGRGAVLVAMIVMLAGLTPLPRDPWWRESTLISPFQTAALWLKKQAPSGVAGKIRYRH